MKHYLGLVICGIVFACAGNAHAAIDFYVDSAPNAYGSPAWAPWWETAKADVVAGTFTNMRSGTFPGTTGIDPYDEIVYSVGDLGKRLHWIYWVPDTTIAELTGNFEAKWAVDWYGVDYTYVDGGWAIDGSDVGWAAPTRWEEYNGGVIGTFGFAWWATGSDGKASTVTQDDIDALRQRLLGAQTYAMGAIRYRGLDTTGDVSGAPLPEDWQVQSLQTKVVPEPATAIIWSVLGVSGMAAAIRRRKQAASA